MKGQLSRQSQRRFLDHTPPGAPDALAHDHPAAVAGTSRFTSRRAAPTATMRLLKDGHNNRKIGRRVAKGRLRGLPIYTLTLEERATCPRSCLHWYNCYGNKMQWPVRIAHGPRLQAMLRIEVGQLAREHPGGFLVRLHVLGDFHSIDYVAMWLDLLIQHPALHIFGYTAHDPSTPIGQVIDEMAHTHWARFSVRFSNPLAYRQRAAITSYDPNKRGRTSQGVVCPAQTGDAACCGSCGLCWNSEQPIVFLVH